MQRLFLFNIILKQLVLRNINFVRLFSKRNNKNEKISNRVKYFTLF